jgi:hypothetical protein
MSANPVGLDLEKQAEKNSLYLLVINDGCKNSPQDNLEKATMPTPQIVY